MRSRLNEDEALSIIESTGALRTGHFVLVSERHSDKYVNKDDVAVHPQDLDRLALSIADQAWGNDVDVVASPAIGAIALGGRVAFHYNQEVKSVFAEQVGDEFVFRRGYDRFIQPGIRVLVVEDIITTGKTTRAMMRAVEKLGGEVVGVGLLWNRSTEQFSVPVYACVTKTLPTYDAAECKLCLEGIQVNTDVGHGTKFIQEHGRNPRNWPANKQN